jgi:imidazoleglycerol-phosphate dehydratase
MLWRCADETESSCEARHLEESRLMPRTATIHRKTNETDIALRLNLDGRGRARIRTGIRFFDHMLELVARHGGFDLELNARGDLDVDQHHTVEDVGIVLGEAVTKALSTKRGILRAGYFLMPMDETLAASAVDLGGRPFCVVNTKIVSPRVGDFQTELTEDFFQGFAQAARANVHLRVLYGRSSHHQIEAIFKAFARALRFAVARDKRLRRVLPSTKGLL